MDELTTITYKVFFDLNHIEEFAELTVRRPQVPLPGDEFVFRYGLPSAKVTNRRWDRNGQVVVDLDVERNDRELYRFLAESGWSIRHADPDFAS